jgi:hypothetical protein
MSHQPYAPFDLDCVKDIIRMVRGRTVREELPLFAKCVHTLTGTALGATIGEPYLVEPSFGAAEVSDADLNEAAAALQEYQGASFGAEGDSAEAIDPATLAMLIQLAVTLISKWLERRQQGS